MNGFNSRKTLPDHTIYEEPRDSEIRNGYVDLRRTSENYRRYDELGDRSNYNECVQHTSLYTDILTYSENNRTLNNPNSKNMDFTPARFDRGSKLCTILVVSIVVTCILSIGVTVLIFHFVNNNKNDSLAACKTLNCETGQCYVNAEGQAICVGSDGTSGIPDMASFYIPEIESECPDGWLTHKNSCYKEYGMRRTWFQSRDFCRSIGGDLVSVLDNEEAKFIDTHLNEKFGYWIGLSNFELGDNFTWSDGSQSRYSNWNSGEPNNFNNNEHCGQLSIQDIHRQWNDNNCFMSLKFICKKGKMPQCGPGSWFYDNNSCYLFETDITHNWNDARIACRNISANLVSINSIRENNFVVSLVTKLSSKNAWMGLREKQNGKYLWDDGSKPTVFYWGITVPNESVPNCVRILTKYGTWVYEDCNDINGYICEKKIL